MKSNPEKLGSVLKKFENKYELRQIYILLVRVFKALVIASFVIMVLELIMMALYIPPLISILIKYLVGIFVFVKYYVMKKQLDSEQKRG